MQLFAFRYPGRLLRPRDAIPEAALRFVAEQIRVGSDALAAYPVRPQTRREQLDGLREAFGFHMFGPGHGRGLVAWLLPVALATTSASNVASALMDELRQRRIIAPAPARWNASSRPAWSWRSGTSPASSPAPLAEDKAAALDALLHPKEGAAMSVLAWARQVTRRSRA